MSAVDRKRLFAFKANIERCFKNILSESFEKLSVMKSSAVKNGSFTGAALRFFRNI